VPALDGGRLTEQHLMTLTLSCDHRILYGADAAIFLSDIREALEHPLRLWGAVVLPALKKMVDAKSQIQASESALLATEGKRPAMAGSLHSAAAVQLNP
jgi:2-oxoacid dehydrogenases acyltransferase (catalytic domain)